MAYDEGLAERIRAALELFGGGEELKMMGGLCFMRSGNMTCGVIGDSLMLRLGKDGAAAALGEPYVAPMQIGGGRTPKAFVTVGPDGISEDTVLRDWIARAVAFADSLPPKSQRRR